MGAETFHSLKASLKDAACRPQAATRAALRRTWVPNEEALEVLRGGHRGPRATGRAKTS